MSPGRWEGVPAAELPRRWGVPAVHLFASIGSTNDAARELAERGAPAGTVVIADEQTAGRGRSGRSWASAPGLGLWMSVVLRPAELPAPGLLPILVGLGAAEALDAFAGGAAVGVKWPNDLWVGGRKLAGVLCEAVGAPGAGAAVVAGIGVNVRHGTGDFPPELADSATSLARLAGAAPTRAAVAGAVLRGVLRRAGQPAAQLPGAVLEALGARDVLAGRAVRVESPAPMEGTALGINAAGALLVRVDGVLRTVVAGTVRPLAP